MLSDILIGFLGFGLLAWLLVFHARTLASQAERRAFLVVDAPLYNKHFDQKVISCAVVPCGDRFRIVANESDKQKVVEHLGGELLEACYDSAEEAWHAYRAVLRQRAQYHRSIASAYEAELFVLSDSQGV